MDLATKKGILRFRNDQLSFASGNYHAAARQFWFVLSGSLDVIDSNTRLPSAVYNYRLALFRTKKVAGTLLMTVPAKQ